MQPGDFVRLKVRMGTFKPNTLGLIISIDYDTPAGTFGEDGKHPMAAILIGGGISYFFLYELELVKEHD